MKIRMFKRSLKPSSLGTRMISEDHDLKLGEYNEFYLPSVNLDQELFVVVTDDAGEETVLHLKR